MYCIVNIIIVLMLGLCLILAGVLAISTVALEQAVEVEYWESVTQHQNARER